MKKPIAIDASTQQPVEWDEYHCNILASKLRDLRTASTVDLKDTKGNFNITLDVSAIILLDDGSAQVYGGAGSDENYGVWCFVLPQNLHSVRGYAKTIAYFHFHPAELLLPIQP